MPPSSVPALAPVWRRSSCFWWRRPLGAPLRKLSFQHFLAVDTATWLAIILLCLEGIPRLLGWESAEGILRGQDKHLLMRDAVFSFCVALVVNFALRVRSLIGPRVLFNFVLGRYQRPLREQRAFMFLDLAGSTALAERLGDERVQAMIARFFFDIAEPIAEYGGETHRYIGDEVVVTWPLERAREDARCLRCVAAIARRVTALAEGYRRDFGEVPRYRVGMHGGPVVASEVGDEKREIVYFGDTINTAARLGALCKELGRDWLVSGDLIDGVNLPPDITLERLGPKNLRGKDRPVAVYALKGR
jgi:adenylate cyclase